jgi:tetratricopeptide (TPR) repeat protein
MLALHSFWYEEARDEFQAATKVEPAFAMGYWGEALTYYHPVWNQEDLAGARAAMEKIRAESKLTAREQALILAARVLFGEGTQAARWDAYADELGKLHDRFVDDNEVATLWAVAILGNAYRERFSDEKQAGFRRFALAGSIALDVLGRNPKHPGAAHYVIHAFDDPEHAVLALPAARLYANIAPEAPHALHMPSHIFVQLGMWREALASNESAWAASVVWTRAKQLDTSALDFHSLSWLLSIALELGQRQHANEVLARGRAALTQSKAPYRVGFVLGMMGAEYIQKTGEWDRIDELLSPMAIMKAPSAGSAAQQATPGCTGHVDAAPRGSLKAKAWSAFIHGEAAAARKDRAALARSERELAATVKQMTGSLDQQTVQGSQMLDLELQARAAELEGRIGDAIETLRRAITLEESVPPAGPTFDILGRERLGELLLRQNRAKEALPEFQRVLVTHPRHARSLLGAARAATLAAEPGAHDYYAELSRVWAHADEDQPAMAEVARAMVNQTSQSSSRR